MLPFVNYTPLRTMRQAYDALILSKILFAICGLNEPTALGTKISKGLGKVWMDSDFAFTHSVANPDITDLYFWTLIADHVGFYSEIFGLKTAQDLYPARIHGLATQLGFGHCSGCSFFTFA